MRLRHIIALAASASIAGSNGRVSSRAESDPPPSAGHNLVYAPDLHMVLLVNAGLGGMSTPPANARTRIWAWNGSSWRAIDSAGPPVRNLAGVAYDTRRNTLVMHGGTYDVGKSYGETWEWSAKTGWTRFIGDGPGIRDHTQLAYDAARGRAVLFGGSGENPNVAFADTWEFDGTRWERKAESGPPARVHHAMQYDPRLQRVVVFGGFTPGVTDLGDTWSWDGSRWMQIAPPVAPRTHIRIVFDGHRNALLVAGGVRETTLAMLSQPNRRWAPVTISPEPPARYLTDMAYDETRKVIVLFGGGDSRGNDLFNDTWEYDGTSWKRVRPR